MSANEQQASRWVVDRVQTRLAEHGTWDQVSVSDASLAEYGQWLFRIARGSRAHVFAVPAAAQTEAEVDVVVDEAVARLERESTGSNGH